jgi:hypothetical protein
MFEDELFLIPYLLLSFALVRPEVGKFILVLLLAVPFAARDIIKLFSSS